jgi:hypothetical protein
MSEELLPMGRTCFYEIIIPSYASFDVLKAKMDTALLFGAKGFTHV